MIGWDKFAHVANLGLKRQSKPMYVEDYVRLAVTGKEMDADMTRELLWRLLDASQRMNTSMNRAMIGTLATGAAFELLNRELVSEVSGGGIKLAQLDPLRLLLPAVLAYLFLRTTVLARETKLLDECFQEIVRQRYPGFFSSNINYLLTPPAGFAVGEFPTQLARMGKRTGAIHRIVVGVEVAIMAFAPPVIVTYMYVQLFLREGPGSLAVWVGLAVTLLVLGAAYTILLIEANTAVPDTTAPPRKPEAAAPAPRVDFDM